MSNTLKRSQPDSSTSPPEQGSSSKVHRQIPTAENEDLEEGERTPTATRGEPTATLLMFNSNDSTDYFWTLENLVALSGEVGQKSANGEDAVFIYFKTFDEMREKENNTVGEFSWTVDMSKPPMQLTQREIEEQDTMVRHWLLHQKKTPHFQSIFHPRWMWAVNKIVVLHLRRPGDTAFLAQRDLAEHVAQHIANIDLYTPGLISIVHQVTPQTPQTATLPGLGLPVYRGAELEGARAPYYGAKEYTVKYVQEPNGFLEIDNNTLVIYFDDHQPIRQIIGDYFMSSNIRPAGLICPDIDQVESGDLDTQKRGRDHRSLILSTMVNTEGYHKLDWISQHPIYEDCLISDLKAYFKQ